MPVPTITIASIDRTTKVQAGASSIDLSYTLGARGVLRCTTIDLSHDSTGAYRPAVDQLIELSIAGTVFAGRIVETDEAALGAPDKYRGITIAAVHHSAILSQRTVNDVWTKDVPYTQKQIVTWMVLTYLAGDGVTVDPTMADGPTYTEGMVFENETVESVLNYLSSLSGWPWQFGHPKVIHMWAPGSLTAAYAITNANARSCTVRKARTQYANRILLKYGGQQEVVEGWTGDGATVLYALRWPCVVNDDGMPVSVGYVLEDDHTGFPVKREVSLYPSGTSIVKWDPAVNALRFGYTPASGVTLLFKHTVSITLTEIVEDAAEIAARGLYEHRVDVPNTFDRTHVRTLGAGILRQKLIVPREAVIRVTTAIVYPGYVISIALPAWNLTGTWLVTACRVRDLSNDLFEYELTCLEGDEAQPSWLDYYRQSAIGAGGSRIGPATLTPPVNYTPTGIAERDVIANAGLTGKELRLTDLVTAHGGGPGLQLGPGSTIDDTTWLVLATRKGFYTPAEKDARLNVTLQQDQANGYATQWRRMAFGQYLVLPAPMVGTGGPGSYLGDPLNLTGDASGLRTWAGIRTNLLSVLGPITERGRIAALGEWRDTTYTAAGNFVGSGAMTWTVTLANQVTLRFTWIGKTIIVAWNLTNTNVGGTAGTALRFPIPSGDASAKAAYGVHHFIDAGTHGIGACYVAAGGTHIELYKTSYATPWTLTAGSNTDSHGTFAFEIV